MEFPRYGNGMFNLIMIGLNFLFFRGLSNIDGGLIFQLRKQFWQLKPKSKTTMTDDEVVSKNHGPNE